MQTQQLILITLGLGIGINYPLLIGSISRSLSGQEQGIIMGVVSSLDGFSDIIEPILGGALLSSTFQGGYL